VRRKCPLSIAPDFSKICSILFIYLTSSDPLSYQGEGELVMLEGLRPS
jgi:hypothetical protein